MRRSSSLIAALAVAALALAPGVADARAGGGASMGSRGGRSFSAPPPTNTAPFAAQPFERSITPRTAPSPGFAAPGQPAFSGRSAFTSGLLGGLVGAGLGGLLFGHGLFGGVDGIGSMFGLLLQLALLFFIGRWLFRTFLRGRQPAFAGLGNFARTAQPGPRPQPMSMGGGAATQPVAITRPDYEAFDTMLKSVQAAWSTHDLNALRTLSTPEMASYFAEQLAEQTSRGVRNTVTDVVLDKGDLSEAWSEGTREYATVAMRFSMVDVTRDGSGRVVDGNPSEHITATELWTFVRARGGHWLLSAIQQTR